MEFKCVLDKQYALRVLREKLSDSVKQMEEHENIMENLLGELLHSDTNTKYIRMQIAEQSEIINEDQKQIQKWRNNIQRICCERYVYNK